MNANSGKSRGGFKAGQSRSKVNKGGKGQAKRPGQRYGSEASAKRKRPEGEGKYGNSTESSYRQHKPSLAKKTRRNEDDRETRNYSDSSGFKKKYPQVQNENRESDTGENRDSQEHRQNRPQDSSRTRLPAYEGTRYQSKKRYEQRAETHEGRSENKDFKTKREFSDNRNRRDNREFSDNRNRRDNREFSDDRNRRDNREFSDNRNRRDNREFSDNRNRRDNREFSDSREARETSADRIQREIPKANVHLSLSPRLMEQAEIIAEANKMGLDEYLLKALILVIKTQAKQMGLGKRQLINEYSKEKTAPETRVYRAK